jgi:hypothetical protein
MNYVMDEFLVKKVYSLELALPLSSAGLPDLLMLQ